MLGAVLALPMAAMFPTIEQLWFRKRRASEMLAEHERLGACARGA